MSAKTLRLLLLAVPLCVVQAARAAGPRAHHLHGVVQSVDATAHTLTVDRPTKKPLIIEWSGRTRLREGKEPAQLESLKAGQAVCVYYRVLPGRLEAKRVDVRPKSSDREKGSARGGASDLLAH